MAWHVTPIENLQSIISNGLIPTIGPRASAVGDREPKVHLFTSLASVIDAEWVWDAFAEVGADAEFGTEPKLALLNIAIPNQAGSEDSAWMEIDTTIPREVISIITRDLASFIPTEVYESLDSGPEYLHRIDHFRATATEMSGREFASVVGDASFEDDDGRYRIYAAGFYINKTDDGWMLILGNMCYESDDAGLPELEERLFEYVREECGLANNESDPEMEPS